MWWGILFALLLVGCASEVTESGPEQGFWIENVTVGVDSNTFLLTVCTDDPLFQGAFLPFSVEVGTRSSVIDDAPYERIDDACIEVRYVLERGAQEDLLSFGVIAFEIDPEARIMEDRASARIAYAPERVCIDSDGDNPFLSGFVSARLDGEVLFFLDSCSNATATEYVCEPSGHVGVVLYGCRDGCTGGSCTCRNSATCEFDGSATRI